MIMMWKFSWEMAMSDVQPVVNTMHCVKATLPRVTSFITHRCRSPFSLHKPIGITQCLLKTGEIQRLSIFPSCLAAVDESTELVVPPTHRPSNLSISSGIGRGTYPTCTTSSSLWIPGSPNTTCTHDYWPTVFNYPMRGSMNRKGQHVLCPIFKQAVTQRVMLPNKKI